MSYAKKFGRIDNIKGEGYQFFAGYCKECGGKHYIGVENAREMARMFQSSFITRTKMSLPRFHLPKIKIVW